MKLYTKSSLLILALFSSNPTWSQEWEHEVLFFDTNRQYESILVQDSIITYELPDGSTVQHKLNKGKSLYLKPGTLHTATLTLNGSIEFFSVDEDGNRRDSINIETDKIISNASIILAQSKNFFLSTDKFEGEIVIRSGLMGPVPEKVQYLFYEGISAKAGQNGGNGGSGGNGRDAGATFKQVDLGLFKTKLVPKSYGSEGGGNGHDGGKGMNGSNGSPGIAGAGGRDSGNLHFTIRTKVKKDSKIEMIALGEDGLNGSRGQNGGVGGNGGNGGNGGKGGGAAYDRNASRGGDGGKGGNGGKGGDGGHGGVGGNGGSGGDVTLDVQRRHPNGEYWYKLNPSGGEGGKGGEGGFGGKGGKKGKGGGAGIGGDGSIFKHGGSSGLAGRPGVDGKNGINGTPGEDGEVGRRGLDREPLLILRGVRSRPIDNSNPVVVLLPEDR
ncbi:hypothetical protein [uncultured Imperialibacter sp.]|uniref:hypothetical protein n=1 Tax=uncultured Imperialibacter sp. TaxID=1672639 RepID=UPI0030D78E6C|tara:strand:- start:39646 stop:40965 length:1320 start_codon:yes stop_codon:yes gene_type:complete